MTISRRSGSGNFNRHRASWVAALALCAKGAAPAVAQSEAGLVNGGFEAPGQARLAPTGWIVEKGTFVLDDRLRSEGRFSGRLDGGNGSATAYQDVAAKPGTAHTLSGLWRNGDRTADFDTAVVEVSWLNKPGGDPVGEPMPLDSGEVAGSWVKFATPAQLAPATAGAARITLRSKFGIAAFDDLRWARPGADTPAAAPAGPTPAAPVKAAPAIGPAGPAAARLQQAGPVEFSSDLDGSRRRALAERKPLMLYFSSDTEACRRLESQVFSDPKVAELLRSRWVCVKLDMATNRDLAFSIKVYKSGIMNFYGPDGRFVAQGESSTTAAELLEMLQAAGK